MRLCCLPVFAFGVALAAQSPLTTSFAGTIGLPASATNPNVYFNLTVSTTVTLQALDLNLASANGTSGSIDLWITNPGTTTYVGNTGSAANWTLAASATCTAAGPGNPSTACLTTGVVLQPGTYGVAVGHTGLLPRFTNGLQPAANNELSLQPGAVQSVAFQSVALPNYTWNGSIHYLLGSQPHSCSSVTAYGTGCYTIPGSFYQMFTTSAATAATLNGRSLTMLPTGVGYIVSQASVPYIAPGPNAISLPTNDDGEMPVTLPQPFSYPGGATTTLHVCTNGFVSVNPNSPAFYLPLGNNWTPNPVVFLACNETAWWTWHELSTAEAGSGTIKTEDIGQLFVITWDGVESYPLNVVNPCTFQFQFDMQTGEVHFVWVTMEAIGGNGNNDGTLIGFSPAGPSIDPGPIDITTLAPLVLRVPDLHALALTATQRPAFNSVVGLTTGNVVGVDLGLNFLGLGQIPAPGIDLSLIGAPGCPALVNTSTAIGNLISNLPGLSLTVQLPIPGPSTALNGFALYSQSIWLSPTSNNAGFLTSNALRLVIGYY